MITEMQIKRRFFGVDVNASCRENKTQFHIGNNSYVPKS